VPTIIAGSLHAVDHEAFYGPIFFRLAALAFQLFGFSIQSMRFVSIAGAVAIAVAAAQCAGAFGATRHRMTAAALLLLIPSVGTAATSGRMDTVAVACGLGAAALCLRGIVRGGSIVLGAASGGLLAAAALTTPRAWPFVVSFVVASAAILPRVRRVRVQAAVAVGVAAALTCAWATVVHGDPWRWLGQAISIGTRVSADVAIAEGARRNWAFAPWLAIVPVAAAIALVAWWRRRDALDGDAGAAVRFALALAVANLALCTILFNLTFLFAVYFSAPLLAVVLALPMWQAGGRRAAIGLTILLAAVTGVRVVKYVRVAATWQARDPAPMDAFLRQVPAGSIVFGPPHFYYYSAERAGSEYRVADGVSWADWARWGEPRNEPRDDVSGRPAFLVWPLDREEYPVPDAFTCALAAEVGTFAPAGEHLAALGPLGSTAGIPASYPASGLYNVDAGCR